MADSSESSSDEVEDRKTHPKFMPGQKTMTLEEKVDILLSKVVALDSKAAEILNRLDKIEKSLPRSRTSGSFGPFSVTPRDV